MPQSSSTPGEARRAVPGLLVLTLAVWTLVGGYLLLREHAGVAQGFPDSDDATRMTMVRDLLHGRGWYDQRLLRFQPPLGVFMHWSRLLDGALAALDGALSSLFGPLRGERLMRMTWPILLIGPAVACGLAITRRFVVNTSLQGRAMLAAAAVCVVSLPLYAQFHPGRIDHHNVQILLWLVAYAGAMQGPPKASGAALTGFAIGLGLAIGLEAAPFDVAIAGFMALRYVWNGAEARRLGVFSLALFVAATACFLLQTPPDRWSLSACDAMAANLVAALLVGSALLALVSLRPAARRWIRAAGVGAAGALAAVAYAALAPRCLRGPFAEIDPRIRSIWLGDVQEMSSLPQLMHHDPATALAIAAAIGLGCGCWGVAALSAERRRAPAFWLGGVMAAIGAVCAFSMLRMSSYMFWAAVPPIATAAAMIAQRLSQRLEVDRVRLVLVALLLSPSVCATVLASALHFARPAHASEASSPPDRCFEANSYGRLAALPAGRVLSEPDLGPYVIAYTSSAAIAAPYHRMAVGLLAAHATLEATGEAARTGVHRLGVKYVVSCAAHAGSVASRSARTLQAAVAMNRPPSWLERLSSPAEPLQVYRLR